MHIVWTGNAGYGKKSIADSCNEMLLAAKANPINFQAPVVCFVFAGGVGVPVCV